MTFKLTASFAHLWEYRHETAQPHCSINIFADKGQRVRTEWLYGEDIYNCLKYVIDQIWSADLTKPTKTFITPYPELFAHLATLPNYKQQIYNQVCASATPTPLKQHEILACEDLIKHCKASSGSRTILKYWLNWIWLDAFSDKDDADTMRAMRKAVRAIATDSQDNTLRQKRLDRKAQRQARRRERDKS